MDALESLQGLPGWVYLALILSGVSAVLLLIVLFWLKRRVQRNNSSASQHVGLISEAVVEAPTAVLSDGERKIMPGGEDPTAPVSQPLKHRNEATISKYMKIAEMARDQKALAALYLERARLDLSNGDSVAAGDHLRKSIMLSTTHNLKKIHAEARLELADISQADGDPTTACEHWQMARGLFHELDAQDDVKKTDQHMLSNGCPTDWVLTDF